MPPHHPEQKMAPKEGEKLEVPPKAKKTEEVMSPAPATIIVSLPAEAKLLIDGSATKSISATRVFTSPALEPGKQFAYTLTGELLRDGRTVTTSKQVVVRAGAETQVQLDFPAVSVVQK
jgi:uncharacterized protein (TIGR03000 family)